MKTKKYPNLDKPIKYNLIQVMLKYTEVCLQLK